MILTGFQRAGERDENDRQENTSPTCHSPRRGSRRMRNLTAFLCLTFAVLLFSAGEGFALPPCPEDPNQRFHNCFGTYINADGNKYVGEWRDDKYHGQGTYYYLAD